MIELPKPSHAQAVASVERYCREHLADYLDHPIGNVAAAGLLNFFLREVGPSIYNLAITQAQERIQAQAQELDIELHEAEFGYWKSAGKSAGKSAPKSAGRGGPRRPGP